MKIFISLILLITSLVGMAQTKNNTEYYKVYRIYAADNYYLIFLRKDNEKYTIYSEKGITVDGQKVVQDSLYYFDLMPVTDTLTNGKSMIPMNYMDITYFGHFTGDEIGKLCTAKNLVGIVIPSTSETCKTKKKKGRK